MLHITKNGRGATAAAVVKGSGVADRRAHKRQRAALAAAILAGDVGFKPTRGQLAQIFGVSAGYIDVARQLSPAERAAIIAGADKASFAAVLVPPTTLFALPAPKIVSDATLEEIIRAAGIDRALTAAIAVEACAN